MAPQDDSSENDHDPLWRVDPYDYVVGVDAVAYRATLKAFRDQAERDYPELAGSYFFYDQTRDRRQLEQMAQRIVGSHGSADEHALVRDKLGRALDHFQANRIDHDGNIYAQSPGFDYHGKPYSLILTLPPGFETAGSLMHTLAHEFRHHLEGSLILNHGSETDLEQRRTASERTAALCALSFRYMQDPSPANVTRFQMEEARRLASLPNGDMDRAVDQYRYVSPPEAINAVITRTQDYLRNGGAPSLASAMAIGNSVAETYPIDPLQLENEQKDLRDVVRAGAILGEGKAFQSYLSEASPIGQHIAQARQALPELFRTGFPELYEQLLAGKAQKIARPPYNLAVALEDGFMRELPLLLRDGSNAVLTRNSEEGSISLAIDTDRNNATGYGSSGYDRYATLHKDGSVEFGPMLDTEGDKLLVDGKVPPGRLSDFARDVRLLGEQLTYSPAEQEIFKTAIENFVTRAGAQFMGPKDAGTMPAIPANPSKTQR
jgi:hypothetical protein